MKNYVLVVGALACSLLLVMSPGCAIDARSETVPDYTPVFACTAGYLTGTNAIVSESMVKTDLPPNEAETSPEPVGDTAPEHEPEQPQLDSCANGQCGMQPGTNSGYTVKKRGVFRRGFVRVRR